MGPYVENFTEAPRFHSGHALPGAGSRGNSTSGFNRDLTILEEKDVRFEEGKPVPPQTQENE